MYKSLLIAASLLLGTTSLAQAQNSTLPLEREPGYVDLAAIETWFQADPIIEVNVKGALLKLVAEASRYEDPELADMLRQLKAVQVRGFSMRGVRRDQVETRAKELSKRLESQGWDTVVRVWDDGDQVDMFVKVNGDAIAGMMVMVTSPDEDESIFVNIVGQIDPEQIGRIGSKFNIDPLTRGY